MNAAPVLAVVLATLLATARVGDSLKIEIGPNELECVWEHVVGLCTSPVVAHSLQARLVTQPLKHIK
jgi:hypothetical protein